MRNLQCAAVAAAIVLACEAGQLGAAEVVWPWQVVELQWTAERKLAEPYVDGLPEGGPAYLTIVLAGTALLPFATM